MFPISWNNLFRKKDGSLVNMEDAMSGGGGGGGGGSIYNHNVLVANGDKKVSFNLVKNSETPYTLDELWDISYNGGDAFELYGAFAYASSALSGCCYSIKAELNGESKKFRIYYVGGSTTAPLSGCTITDHII